MHTGDTQGGGVFSGWQEGGGAQQAAGSLHAPAIVAQHLALLAQVLGVLLALVGHVQAIGLLQGSLQRGRRKRAQGWGGGGRKKEIPEEQGE